MTDNKAMGFLKNSDAEPVEVLLAQLGSTETDVLTRCKAATQLAEKLDNPAIMPVVVTTFSCCLKEESNARLLQHIINLIGRKKLYSMVDPLVGLLLASGETAIEAHHGTAFSQSDDGLKIRVAAAQALGRMEDPRASVPLISLLNAQNENYRLRLAAAESLGRLGEQQALNPLIDIVNNDDENSQYLKESAVKALGMLGDIRALEPLLDVFESKKGWLNKFGFVKEQIIEAIGKIGTPSHDRAHDALLLALSDRTAYIRLAAVESLAEVGDRQTVPHLLKCLFDKSEDVACAAVNTLFQIGGEDLVREILTTNENLPLFVREELEAYVP